MIKKLKVDNLYKWWKPSVFVKRLAILLMENEKPEKYRKIDLFPEHHTWKENFSSQEQVQCGFIFLLPQWLQFIIYTLTV